MEQNDEFGSSTAAKCCSVMTSCRLQELHRTVYHGSLEFSASILDSGLSSNARVKEFAGKHIHAACFSENYRREDELLLACRG